MSMKSFLGSDGAQWTAWLVHVDNVSSVPGTPTEWLAFQKSDGTERRRLFDVPAQWAEISDERLDMLRRIAEPVKLLTVRHSPPSGVDQQAVSIPDADS